MLDEPTNDLDMDTLDLLQEILAEFAGTLLLVSHDRDFLDRLVTSVIAFEGGGRMQEYAGGYRDYLRQRRPVQEPVADGRAAGRQAKAGPRPAAAREPPPARARPGDRRDRGARDRGRGPRARALGRGPVRPRSRRRSSGATERLAELRGALEAAERRWSALEAQLAEAGA